VQVAEALAYATSQGILHRDIKPSNLLLDMQGTVWVTDFGLAKAADSEDLTHTGDVVGTLRYMAPERLQGKSDPRCDVYSLGITLYELLTLRPAFIDADRARLMQRVAQEEPPRPRKLDRRIPRDLETIVLKAMDKEPARRYAASAEVAEDLRRFLTDRPVRARPVGVLERLVKWAKRRPAVAALASVVVFLLVGVTGVSTISAVRIAAAAEENRQRLVHSQVAGGVALMERGDPQSALPLFAEALRLDQGDPMREKNHRLRLSATLRRLPKLVACWSTEAGPGRAVYCPDGRRVIVTGSKGLQIWDVTADRLTLQLAKDSIVTDFAFSPDGSRVATADKDNAARVWNLETGQPITPPLQHAGAVNQVAFRPEGRQLVTANEDKSARLWDARTGEQVCAFTHDKGVQSASFSADGKRLVTRSEARITVWDAAGGKSLSHFDSDKNVGHQETVFSADGRRIIVTAREPVMRTWDAEEGQLLSRIPQNGRVWLSPDRSRAVISPVVAGWEDLPAQVWDVITGQPSRLLWNRHAARWNAPLVPRETDWRRLGRTGRSACGPLRAENLWPDRFALGRRPPR
jgi:hypothetical protein